ncbi:hypothetical protein HYG86_14810 [Alkalicella caledoniensis]|uniref:Uncharacterized protein n=1 Tax=Alkalicella caledoniensis TaxID=2731377 RepID=A0A7G9WB83_ALKCA|nr:hypothetical protein [Alkalicella caledoniensis]QNO15945.1 hypothetical protein HYG86_14810 [Alkalicella caledoniensis]
MQFFISKKYILAIRCSMKPLKEIITNVPLDLKLASNTEDNLKEQRIIPKGEEIYEDSYV